MIEFSSVEFQHPNGVTALKGIDLTIKSGDVISIVGENGAGKTSLIKHINGLLKPTKGSVSVFGVDTRKESVSALSRHIGIVFQNPSHQLFSESVEDEIRFGMMNFGFEEELVAKRLNWALNLFDLERYRTISPMLLSGGEKKRLCFASVLSWDPKVVILDEPTSGQDFLQKENLMNVIKLLSSQGKTIIIVTHDIEFIWPLQPRIVVMAGGRIVKDGLAEKVLNDEDVLKRARLLKPHLLSLTEGLVVKPREQFSDVFDAKKWLVDKLRG